MQLSPYLSFKGNCEEAFLSYAECFGGQVGEIFRYGGSPMADQVPGDWDTKVMHGSVTLGTLVLMGADVAPNQYEAPKGFSVSVHLNDVAEAERIFQHLSQAGQVVMPMEKTFWAERFGMLVDRFGIPWTVNCDVVG